MSCESIETCQCIKRISLLLDKYENYQDIIQPLATYNDIDSTETGTNTNATDDNIINHSNNNLNTVEYVEVIDNYNDDMMQYDDDDDDGNEQQLDDDEEEEDDDDDGDILRYLDKLNITQILDDYNHIIIDHYTDDFQSIYNLITSQYSHFYCDMNHCRQFLRNNRCRETEDVLHCNVEIETNEYSQDHLVSIDLLDSIHCHLLHSFDIGYNIKSEDLYLINDENKNNEDIAPQINFDQLRQIALNKKQRIIKIRGLDRIKTNKFKTKRKCKQKTQTITEETKIDQNDNNINPEEIKMNDNDEKLQNGHIVTNRIRSFSKEDIEQNVYKFGIDAMIEMSAKYNNLKQEILNNNICKLDIKIYTHIIVKAQRKLSCDISRSLTSDEYGPLLVENIMVLILYCDFDKLRNGYFNILNNDNYFEEREKLNEFYNVHNGLENTVRLYGISVSDKKSTFYLKKIKKFYHCCSSQIIFPGVKCQFFNITSMSANIAPVALYNYDNDKNEKGIILEFGPYDLYIKYFTCSWISCYGAEDERLFINNKGSLELKNITLINNISQQIDFRLFFEALSCFDGSLKEGWKSTSTTNQHYQIISKLIEKKNNDNPAGNISEISYKDAIFEAFCDNKLKIEILVQNLRGPFCKLLFKSDTNTSYRSASAQLIGFDFLCGLFKNCRIIKTWYVANPDYNQHSGITKEWMNSLYVMLDDINKYKLTCLLNKIIINNHHQKVEPIICQQDIIELYENKFFEKGWKIYLNKYSDEMDEIIMNKIMIWNKIKINKFNINNGYYYISTDIVSTHIIMKYNEFRDLFEEINKKLSSEKKSKLRELKKIFPSKVLFKKNNNEKLMKQRKEKLNEYFEKLIKYANDKEIKQNQSNIKMIIMTTLTQYLIK